MESKQIVLSGLVATALLTAIVLSGWVAYIVLAFLILLAGVALTYYIALNQKRIQQSTHLRDLIKAVQEIERQDSSEQAMGQLAGWSKRLLKMEYTMVQVSGEGGFQTGDSNLISLWKILREKIEKSKVLIEFNKSENDNIVWPQGVVWLAAYTLPIAGNIEDGYQAVLLLADVNRRELNREAQETLEVLGRQSAIWLQRWQDEQNEQEDNNIVLKSLLAGMEASEPRFLGHSARVYAISRLIASKLGLEQEEMKALEYSAWLHDIGKGAEAAINEQQTDEGVAISDHASLGADLIPSTGIFDLVRETVRHHHERYDGSGYPLGLSRTEIPFLARIIAVADVYDALTRLCSEEERIDHSMAIRIIKKGTGTLFDPLVVVALEEVEKEIALLSTENNSDDESDQQIDEDNPVEKKLC